MDYFNRLRGNYGLRPVLTHIERYENLMANENLVLDLVDEDILIQTNVGAFKHFSQKRRLLKYIKRGYIDIVGTDCHNPTRGNPDEFLKTINLIKEKCGQEYIDHILETSEDIFSPYKK
jgi:protein-tyrosine phosphatase